MFGENRTLIVYGCGTAKTFSFVFLYAFHTIKLLSMPPLTSAREFGAHAQQYTAAQCPRSVRECCSYTFDIGVHLCCETDSGSTSLSAACYCFSC